MRELPTPREALVESVERLRMRGFEPPDRMAWLSLTSKNERPLCDAVAWELHGILARGTAVKREWRRFDIAVLADGAPVLLVEAKAGFAAEMIDAKRPTRGCSARCARTSKSSAIGHRASRSARSSCWCS